jgi:hypothetical protein
MNDDGKHWWWLFGARAGNCGRRDGVGARIFGAKQQARHGRGRTQESRKEAAGQHGVRLDKVNVQEPDSVYKEQADGRYSVGIKYGNRYLAGAIDGSKYIGNVGEDKLATVLEFLATDAEAGKFDAQIKAIMQANVAARDKVKH